MMRPAFIDRDKVKQRVTKVLALLNNEDVAIAQVAAELAEALAEARGTVVELIRAGKCNEEKCLHDYGICESAIQG